LTSDLLAPRRDAHLRTRAWVTLGFLAMLQFLIAVDVTVVNVALPSIGRDFGVGAHALTWVIVGYTITGGGLLMLGGRLGDVLGRRRVLLAGTTLFGAASLLAGLAPSLPVLVVARLLQGAGEALALPAAMAMIVMLFPEGPRRSLALGVWAAVASTGLVVGFALSGVITELLGWRWVFLISVPFVVVVLGATVVLVPPGARQARVRLDLPGALLLTAAPLLFVLGVVEVSGGGDAPWLGAAALVGAVLAAGLFARVERRAPAPLVPLRFFRQPARARANLATALLSAALSTSFLLLTFHLQQRAGLSPLSAGVTLLPLAVALIAAATVAPRLLARWGVRRTVLSGIGSTALGMIAIAVPASAGAGALAVIPGMLLIAVGMGLGLVGLQYAAVSGVTDGDAGIASGVQRAADQLGGASGVALYVGVGFAPGGTGVDPFVLSGALAVVGLVAAGLVAARIAVPTPDVGTGG
jgi:EmrB/QacA subfamily drug resistance transporter